MQRPLRSYLSNDSQCFPATLLLLFVLLFLTAGANASVKLSGTLASGEDVKDHAYQVTNDGESVVYIVRNVTNDKIYKASVEGGTPVLLASLPSDGRVVTDLKLSPDDLYVVVEAYLNDIYALYLLALDGTGGLQPLMFAGGERLEFEWSPSGRHIVYQESDTHSGHDFDLYSVSISEDTSSAPASRVHLNERSFSVGSEQFKITPDGQYVIYVAAETGAGEFGLYRVPVEGGVGPMSYGCAIEEGSELRYKVRYEISPDSTRVICHYVIDEAGSYYKDIMYSMGIDGTPKTQLYGAQDSNIGFSNEIEFTPDGSRVIYRIDNDVWSVITTGGTSVLLGETNSWLNGFQVLSDSSRVIINDNGELLSCPIAGGDPIVLQSNVSNYLVSAEGSMVVCMAEAEVDDYAIFSVSPMGEDLTRIVYGGGVKGLVDISDDGGRLIYETYLNSSGHTLYSVSTAAGLDCVLDAAQIELTDNRVSGGVVSSEELTLNNGHLIYFADADTVDVDELYAKALRVEWAPITRQVGAPWETFSSYWDGGMPGAASEVIISSSKFCNLSSAVEVHSIEVRGDSDDDSILDLSGSAALSAPAGITLGTYGNLRGHGLVDTANSELFVETGAEIQVAEGETLSLVGTGENGLLNRGAVTVTGTGSLSAELAALNLSTLATNNGLIEADYARLQFGGGLMNYGTLTLGDYVLVHGDVEHVLGSGGSININGQSIFYGSISNAATFSVNAGGNLIVHGALEGYGIYAAPTGLIQLNGTVSPGFDQDNANFERMYFSSSLTLLANAVVEMELERVTANTDYDVIAVGDHLTLSGTLNVSAFGEDGFSPQAGDTFDLMNAASVSGQFSSIQLPELFQGLYWHDDTISGVSSENWTGEIFVGLTPETYAEFATANSLTGEAADDDDGDGVANLLEYVFATNPKVAASDSRLASRLEHGVDEDQLSVDIAVPGSSDVQLEMQKSTNLASGWTTLSTRNVDGSWTGTYIPEMSEIRAGMKQYKVTVPTAGGKCFYRIKATQR